MADSFVIVLHMLNGEKVSREVTEDVEESLQGLANALGSRKGTILLPGLVVPSRQVSFIELLLPSAAEPEASSIAS